MAITHAFTSSKGDGGDATLVRPSNWNANHVGTDNIVEGRAKSATVTYLSIPGANAVSVANLAMVANRIQYEPILVPTAITLDQLLIEVTTAGAAGKTARLGIYNADTDWQPTSLVLDAGTVAVDTTGVKTITINQALSAGRYLLACWSDGIPNLRFARGGNRYASLLATLGASPMIEELYKSSAYGAYPDPGLAWDSVSGSSTSFRNIVFVRVSTP